ncbi:MAG: amidohydrolase [Chloroflexota bacterium]|nr:amidohydrolase [Chloroflexota bacterium]
MTFLERAQQIKAETIERRREFHRHPELGLEETRTAGIVAETLEDLGLDVTTGVGVTGVVGMLRGAKESPVLLMRFDMDALPIQEETGAAYASENPGKMHACGHDSHVAVGLSVAKLLSEKKESLPGSIKFVFQPGEEGAGGAEKMVDDGVLTDPALDYAMAMHVWNERPVGWYALTEGPVMAGAHIFSIKLTGKGGHGAQPQHTADPIIAAAQVVTALQTVVSRNVDPLDTAVLSVCRVESGTAFNIIPQQAVMEGTIRYFEPEVFERIEKRLREIVENISTAMGCQAEVSIEQVTFPVANNPALARLLADVVRSVDPDAEIDNEYRTMGAEDFSFMMQDIPGCFMLVGSADSEGGESYGHHHPKFNINEDCLPYAVAILTQAAVEVLEKGLGG